jgi:YesN/AraC family two-component response regulator
MQSYLFADKRPAPVGAILSSSPSQADDVLSLQGKRAVIVEDEGITQLQLTKMLRSQGIEVAGTAGNGKEAVDVVLQERPDLVLMDIRMPIMNGLEAAERILAVYRVCIVMLTAFSDAEYQQRAEALGTCGYVLKPITVETLMPQLKTAFHSFRSNP